MLNFFKSAEKKMEETLFNMKFTSKQLQRESKKCEKRQKESEKKAIDAMKKGNREMAQIAASNAIREKNQALNFLRLGSRIDAVAARVETAIRMNTLTKQMQQVTTGMSSVLGSMDVEKIASMMDNFEKQFDNLDVRSGYMENAIQASTATAVPEDEVDSFMQQLAEQHKEELADAFSSVRVGKGVVGSGAAAASSAPTRVAETAGAPPPPSNTNNNNNNGAGGAGDGGAAAGGGGGADSGMTDSLAARLAALRR